MRKKDNTELENTKATGTFVVETDHGIVTNIGYSAIMQPNVKFSGKPMKWFDDTNLLKKKENGKRSLLTVIRSNNTT